MTKAQFERLEQLKDKAREAQYLVNSIRQELEEMGRVRDSARFTRIVDMIDEWCER